MAGARLTVRQAATLGPGRHGDGAGLYLYVDGKGARSWVFKFSFAGRRPEMGLGGFPDVSLADAREAAAAARKLVKAGANPIEVRREEKAAKLAPKNVTPTFGACAEALIESRSIEWRNAKHRSQWRMTLTKYAAPLWDKPVDGIGVEDVLDVLKPHWLKVPETASRLRGRIERVLAYAQARGHIDRNLANPARWKGHLDALLPRPSKLAKRGHHAALHYDQAPEFVAKLRAGRQGFAALALEYLILTAARSAEVRFATWEEIDFDRKLWVIPAARTKTATGHTVPLVGRVLEILEALYESRSSGFIFPGKGNGPLSDGALERVLDRMGVRVTPHGFRSTFRDWCGDKTHFPREIAEAALGHKAGDAVERAYRRGSALEKRRELMQAWDHYLSAALPARQDHAGAEARPAGV
ncbi:MAG: integrase arm-type DNA-binding domain-containing protein [Rhodomicrobium sp.]